MDELHLKKVVEMPQRRCVCTRRLENGAQFCPHCVSQLPEHLLRALATFQHREQARFDCESFLFSRPVAVEITRRVRLGTQRVLQRGETFICTLHDALVLFINPRKGKISEKTETAPPPPAAAA